TCCVRDSGTDTLSSSNRDSSTARSTTAFRRWTVYICRYASARSAWWGIHLLVQAVCFQYRFDRGDELVRRHGVQFNPSALPAVADQERGLFFCGAVLTQCLRFGRFVFAGLCLRECD